MNSIEKLLDMDIKISDIDSTLESTVDIALSRLGGEVFSFPIISLDNATRAELLDASFTVRKNKEDPNGDPDVITHTYKVVQMAILSGCPIFRDKRFRDKFKVRTGEQLIDKLLTLDEATKLSDAIQNLGDAEETDLLSDFDALKDEVKN